MTSASLTPAIIASSEPLLPRAPRFQTLRRLMRHRSFAIGIVLIGALAFAALLAPLLGANDPNLISIRERFQPPSWKHLLGTDSFGRSQLARIAYGAQISFVIGVAVVLLNAIFGTLLGVLSGYFRKVDSVLMLLNDALMAFPALLLAIGVTAMLGPSLLNVVVALAIVYVPRTARIVRGSVLHVREAEYIVAAVASGAGHARIILRHILPNILAPLLVQLSFLFAYSVLAEASLSFLGLGASPSIPTWGNIMADGRQYMREAPWIIAIPGVALGLSVLALNLIGDGLRDILDPRLRVQQ